MGDYQKVGKEPAAMESELLVDLSKSNNDLFIQKMKIVAVVVSYFVVSMSMVFLNKTLLTEGSAIPAPLFVTWYQCVVTTLIISALGRCLPEPDSLAKLTR